MDATQARGDFSLTLTSQVHIQADTLEYLRDQNLVIARGQVHIQQDQVNLYADVIRYDSQSQDVHAEGHVVWQDPGQEVEAQSLDYNLKTGKGKALHIKSIAPPWISTGEEIDMLPHKVVIKNAVTTTCDYPEGYRHYYMAADKITIYSGDYLVAENVVLYIGKVPVFYFPFFVRTIHDLKTPFSVSTGATSYLGNYILLTTNYLFNPKSYGALYTDYFFNKGIGLGLHHEIALNDAQVLSLYGYGIQEKDTGNLRWEGRARMLWALSTSLNGRVEADLPGDGNFSNDYSVARRDPSLVSTTREFDISTTYSNPKYTLGLLLRRQEIADINNPVITYPSAGPTTLYSNFIRSLQTLPELDFTLSPQSLFFRGGPTYDLSFSGNHSYTQANGFYVTQLTGRLGLSQNLTLPPTQTLFGRIEVDDELQDVSDVGVTVGAGAAGETHSLSVQSSWTSRYSEYVNSSFSYNFAEKLNNLTPTDPHNGITQSFLTGRLECDIGSAFREFTSTSFDFNAGNTNPLVTTDAQRFGYVTQEFDLTASPQFDVHLSGDYSVVSNNLKDLTALLNAKSTNGMWRLSLNANYLDPNFTNQGLIPGFTPQPPNFTLGGEVDFAFFTNYRFSLIENYDLTNSQFETRSISLYRDLHDWEAQLQYTQDSVQGERLFFTLNLKAFPGRPISVSDDQLQRLNGLRNQGLTGAASQFQ